ncbi:hypothetical protein BDV33DRAFT_168313 [Aspergillus novoparasiticus]|uniref:Uncharacterized protein n=1 Tax=Aspergillus novoparasiticus TaxID=986946 RepID=A0A5N6EZW4_9EURO|nr:hypothetical protein BDV33DRAFT_168313 [Aspergillus novoparasiticus]
MDKWTEFTGSNLYPLRVYRACSGSQSFPYILIYRKPRSGQTSDETADAEILLSRLSAIQSLFSSPWEIQSVCQKFSMRSRMKV